MQTRLSRNNRNLCPALSVILAIILVFAAPILAAAAANLPPEVRAIIEGPRYRYARWGIFVQDLQTGQTLCAYNADQLFSPASVTKLFTAAAALDRLGPDWTDRLASTGGAQAGRVAGRVPWTGRLSRVGKPGVAGSGET